MSGAKNEIKDSGDENRKGDANLKQKSLQKKHL